MPDLAHIQLADLVLDIEDERVPKRDTEARAVLTEWSSVALDSGTMAQGMTTDGVFLYMASINAADGMTSPKITQINIGNKTVSDQQVPPKNGHYNSLDYHNGYIYATGFNPTDTYDDYSQIYKYYYPSNTGTVITTPDWFWNVVFGKTPYNTNFFVGHVASQHAVEIFCAPDQLQTDDFYPFTKCPIEYYNGIEQGSALYADRFICTIIADPREVGNNIKSNTELRISTLTGETVKVITLAMPHSPEELQDICFVGDRCFINASSGRIYELEDFTTYFRGFYEEYKPTIWKMPCFLYGNENGTETYITGTYSGETGSLLYSFKLAPFTCLEHFSDAIGYFNTRSFLFPFKLNPISGGLNVSCCYTSGNYTYNIRLYYERTSDASNYIYILKEIVGGYRDQAGTVTQVNALTYADIQQAANDIFYTGTSFVHHIVANATCRYQATPLTM